MDFLSHTLLTPNTDHPKVEDIILNEYTSIKTEGVEQKSLIEQSRKPKLRWPLVEMDPMLLPAH